MIIPEALRPLMVKKVHSSHISIDGCLFWPGISAEIKDSIGDCDTCNSYQKNQQKEPLIPHDPPKHPWSHVAADLFTFNNKEWFVDYWSDYFELNQLPMQALSSPPSRVSLHVMAYWTCFIVTIGCSFCREFQEFASDWQFDD